MKVWFYWLILGLSALLLVEIWFQSGDILGTAEGIIPYYNLSYYAQQVSSAWANNNPGLGIANGIVVAYAPTYWLLGLLQSFGIPGWVLEAAVFWLILVVAGLGVFGLTRTIFPTIPPKWAMMASWFYWFSPLSLVNVWNRFLYNYLFCYALLPVAVWLVWLGLSRQRYWPVVALSLISVVFSLGLSAPVFVVLYWSIIGIILLIWEITARSKEERWFGVRFGAMLVGMFAFLHAWWLSQVWVYFHSDKYSQDISNFFSTEANLSTLDSISQILGQMAYLWRLTERSFVNHPGISWSGWYEGWWVKLIEFGVITMVLITLFMKRRQRGVLMCGGLLLLGICLAKGNSPPLGNLYQLIFEQVNLLQFFRNPFEKWSFMIGVGVAPLVGWGLFEVSRRLKPGWGFWLSICLIWGFYGWPFLSGYVFTSPTPPNNDPAVGFRVKVPDYYVQADQWLKDQGSNFRFVGLPYREQGVTYRWEKGYQGVEPSVVLFATPHLMMNTTAIYYAQVADQLNQLRPDSVQFVQALSLLNARYVMVRSDIDFRVREMTDPASISAQLDQNPGLRSKARFGALQYWENQQWRDRTFYLARGCRIEAPVATLAEVVKSPIDNEIVVDQSDQSQCVAKQGQGGLLDYRVVGPNKYQVEVAASQSGWLVFNQAFNSGWELSRQGQVVTNHLKANLYQNSWWVEEGGQYQLEYKPERLLAITKVVSLIGFIGCLGGLIVYWWRRR